MAHAVGVMNGNFRGGMYYDYRKQVEADAKRETLLRVERSLMEDCYALEGESFVEWYESDEVPAYCATELRIDLIKKRIADIEAKPHPSDVAYLLDRADSATEREEAEIESTILPDSEDDELTDTGLNDDRPYHPASLNIDDIPF